MVYECAQGGRYTYEQWPESGGAPAGEPWCSERKPPDCFLLTYI